MTGLPAPAHIYQLDGSEWGGLACMAAAGAMALDAYSRGAIRATTRQIRDNQDDKSGGIGLNDVATAWQRGWRQPFTYGATSWAGLLSRWSKGLGAVITVNYGALGTWRAPGSTFRGAHALYVQRRTVMGAGDGGMIGTPALVVNDPLRRSSVVLPESAVRLAYTGGAGWGRGEYAGPTTGTSDADAKRRAAIAQLAKAGVTSSPDSYVFTQADAEKIARVLYGVDPAGTLGRPIVQRWTGKTVADWIAASAATGYANEGMPLDAIAKALGDLPTTLSRAGIVLGLVVLAIVGVVLTFREASVVAVPSPVKRIAGV